MSTDTASERHPHEPQIPPAIDSEGRCQVCALLVGRDAALGRDFGTAHTAALPPELEYDGELPW